MAGNTETGDSEKRDQLRRPLALAGIIGGAALLALSAMLTWQAATAPPVYRYVLGDEVAPADTGPLAPFTERGLEVRQGSLVDADDRTLADFKVAESPDGPVLVEWNPSVDEPFLTSPAPTGELTDLAEVLERHVPDDGVVFAWWDTSRVLQLLSGVDVEFGEYLGTPLFVPSPWQGASSQVRAIEDEFWNSVGSSPDTERFDRFTAALLEDEEKGMEVLRRLAGEGAAFLVVHVRDAILLGQLAPEKLGIAFRDFPSSGDVHGSVQSVHAWLDEYSYHAYATSAIDEQWVRGVALTDEVSGQTLAARLLPFIGNDQDAVEGTTLVYKTGGFWVYELTSPAGKGERADGDAV